jgi:hypothetical protein
MGRLLLLLFLFGSEHDLFGWQKNVPPNYQSACDFARLVLDGFSETDVAIATAR